jgi:hypothetical protein
MGCDYQAVQPLEDAIAAGKDLKVVHSGSSFAASAMDGTTVIAERDSEHVLDALIDLSSALRG